MTETATLAEREERTAAGSGLAALRDRTFSALRHQDYRYLWIGTLFASSGQWIQQVTLGWLVYALTGSSVMLGLVNGVRAIPFLVTGPFAGVVADRVDRKQLMMTTQALLVVATMVMSALIFTGLIQIWHIFVFTVLTGVAWTFNMPVRQTVVANVVPREDLQNAIALNSVGFNMTRVVGPGIGGVLIALIGAAGNFLLQGLAYCGVVYMIHRTNIPPTPPHARRASMGSNMKEGARWVWSNPVMRTLMALALIPVLFTLPYISLMPVFAEDVLHAGPVGLGLMLAADGAGAVLGALSTAAIKRSNRGRQQLIALALLGACLILFSRMPSLPLALICLVAVGALQMAYMSTNQTLLQMRIPDELRGRVMSIYMLNQGLLPLGSLLAGFLAGAFGAPNTVTFMGIACITVTGAAALLLPGLAELD